LEELRENDLVMEMWSSFGGYFTPQECNRALRSQNGEIEDAVNWLVEEGEQDRVKKEIMKRRSVLLAEAQIVQENQKKNEADIVVAEQSVLLPQDIVTGKWTVSDSQVTLHKFNNNAGVVTIFSKNEADTRQINE